MWDICHIRQNEVLLGVWKPAAAVGGSYTNTIDIILFVGRAIFYEGRVGRNLPRTRKSIDFYNILYYFLSLRIRQSTLYFGRFACSNRLDDKLVFCAFFFFFFTFVSCFVVQNSCFVVELNKKINRKSRHLFSHLTFKRTSHTPALAVYVYLTGNIANCVLLRT